MPKADEILNLLSRITSDSWWNRAWTFQEVRFLATITETEGASTEVLCRAVQ